ncbi:chalcone isomerase family protein [Limnohabitans sp.]|uniref:chalcone isomerase family protein n=2 Tax=Limnohabitans sp. TaxID=1907725 RepID=UPI0025BC9F39|nr:chalcone isomerase family protein [Limnohabitans sp.]
MHTPLKTMLALWLRRQGVRGAGVAVLLAGLHGAAQAQASSVSSPNAGYSRPEVAALSGVVPTAPVRLRVWGFEVYDARLWTPVGFRHSQYAQYSFALELQYLRRLEGAAIASRSIDEMRRVGSFTDAQAQSWLAAMRELFPNVSAGERITGVNLPGVGAEFWVNGQRVGAVNDLAFARLFFGIWLDERSSEPKMRAQLLQGLQP